MTTATPDVPGKLAHIRDLDCGAWFFCEVSQHIKLCCLVQSQNNDFGVLDIAATKNDGTSFPAIYRFDHFMNDTVFCLNKIWIRPSLEIDQIGYGICDTGKLNRAIYITPETLVVRAAKEHSVLSVALPQGKIIPSGLQYALHSKSWLIDYEDEQGFRKTIVTYTV